MADNETYISDLSQIIEIKPADSFIVETTEGTKRILWQDIIVGQDNVDFYNLITQNEVDILTLSANQATLSGNQATLTQDVATLSAANIARDQYGYCYVEISDAETLSTLSTLASSSNITNISIIDSGKQLRIDVDSSIDVSKIAINTTFNYSISVNTEDSTSYQSYTPVVTRNIDDNYFTIAANTIVHTVTEATIVTGVSINAPTISQNVATGTTNTFTGSLSLGDGIGDVSVVPPVVRNTSTNNTNINYIESATITPTNLTVNFDFTDNLGIDQPLQGKTTAGLPENFGINITFRY